MKAYVRIHIECPLCGEVMLRHDAGKRLFCGNPTCDHYLKEYKVPSFDLEPVEQTEWAVPA